MRQYNLYIIDKTFANYYYGRERMFFNLFKDLAYTKSKQLKDILLKQVHFITDPIPSLRVHTIIMQQLQTNENFYIDKRDYVIENDRGMATLKIFERNLLIQSSGHIDTELVFMDALAKSDYNFFAIDLINERYGWIKPKKEKLLSKQKYQNL